jgi:hypothetical protein
LPSITDLIQGWRACLLRTNVYGSLVIPTRHSAALPCRVRNKRCG